MADTQAEPDLAARVEAAAQRTARRSRGARVAVIALLVVCAAGVVTFLHTRPGHYGPRIGPQGVSIARAYAIAAYVHHDCKSANRYRTWALCTRRVDTTLPGRIELSHAALVDHCALEQNETAITENLGQPPPSTVSDQCVVMKVSNGWVVEFGFARSSGRWKIDSLWEGDPNA